MDWKRVCKRITTFIIVTLGVIVYWALLLALLMVAHKNWLILCVAIMSGPGLATLGIAVDVGWNPFRSKHRRTKVS